MLTETHPLISIIVPVYKVEKYLEKCVKSILSQTYKNLEVILIDDGSPDSCPDICDNYANQDIRVKVIHKNNSGVSDARNDGLNVANGEYIGFVDSDDWIDPKMYEILLREILHTNADIAICDYALCKDDGLIYGKAMPQELKNRCLCKEELIHEVLQPYGGFFAVIWNKLYRKSIFDKIRFPSGKHVEDEFVFSSSTDAMKFVLGGRFDSSTDWMTDDGISLSEYLQYTSKADKTENDEGSQELSTSENNTKYYGAVSILATENNDSLPKYQIRGQETIKVPLVEPTAFAQGCSRNGDEYWIRIL